MEIRHILEGEKLRLTNDGNLEICFIGVGSAFARTLNQTNFIIIKGDSHIMVDFGMTGPNALRQVTGLEPTDLEVILPTHSHADHVGGIECLGLMNRYVGIPFMKKSLLKMIINEEYQRILWENTLKGGMEWNEKDEETGQKLDFSDFFEVVRPTWKTHSPREIWEVDYDGIHIEMFRTKHIPNTAAGWESSFVSYGLFIDGHVFVSVDTRYDPDLLDLYADRSSIMFHDVQFFPGAVHAPLGDLHTQPDDRKKKMHLMHYADNWAEQDITGFAGWTEQGAIYGF